MRRSLCTHIAPPLCAAILLFYPSGAWGETWRQTTWQGGPGQPTWSDSTMYSSGERVEESLAPGDLLILSPNDGVWYATGALPGATEVHGLAETPDGTLYAGTNPDARVFKSTDRGATWTLTGSLAGAAYLYDLAVGTDGAVYAATGATGDVYKTTDGGTSWTNTGNLAGAESALSLWASSDGTIYAGTEPNGDVFKTTNGGTSWTNTGNLSGAQAVRAVIEGAGGVLYAGTRPNGIVFKSTDGGTSWAGTPTMSPKPSVVRALLETTDGVLYAGGSPTGDVFESTNGGGSWTLVLDVPGNYSYVLALLESFDHSVYTSIQTTDLEGFIYETTDHGLSWQSTRLAQSEEPLSLIQASERSLYVGSDGSDGVGRVLKAGYFTSGSLVSSVYESPNGSVEYGAIDWTEDLGGGGLVVRVRTDTLPDMSGATDWSLCPPVSKGIDISGLSSVDDRAPFVQYRVDLTSRDVHSSPKLHEISLSFSLDLIPPVLDSALASDNGVPGEGIDDDDCVRIFFDEPTNKPDIPADGIDQILHLSAGHSWRDGAGEIAGASWNAEGTELIIGLSTNVSPPSLTVGDTVSLDGTTITDRWGNGSLARIVLAGSFEPGSGVNEPLEERALPKAFALQQNFPNPFNPVTEIVYEIPEGERQDVAIAVYDVRGRIVREIPQGRKGPGRYSVVWDGTDARGSRVSSGIYFYVLRAGKFAASKKMLVME